MKVYNLQCTQGHGFEGWFGSEADFLDQQARALVSCPLCGAADVQRLPSAPRLNLSANAAAPPVPSNEPVVEVPASKPTEAGLPMSPQNAQRLHQAQAAYLLAVRHVIAHTDDVGARFADEARRIHHGEIDARPIRGQASADEREALRDEGIEVHSLPIPAGLDKPLQ